MEDLEFPGEEGEPACLPSVSTHLAAISFPVWEASMAWKFGQILPLLGFAS